jgi:hypothetical protein
MIRNPLSCASAGFVGRRSIGIDHPPARVTCFVVMGIPKEAVPAPLAGVFDTTTALAVLSCAARSVILCVDAME